MDTINHYVGMYPIAAGGVIEKAFSPFLVGLLIVMLIGFMFINPRYPPDHHVAWALASSRCGWQ